MRIDLVDIVIADSLFDKKIEPTQETMGLIPDNAFGVFVTVSRSYKNLDDSARVHGCIGYWDPGYKTISKQELIEHAKRVGKDAFFSDHRRERFKEDIYEDMNAEIEITFMMQPLMKINENGIIKDLGKEFDNNKHGLIVEDQGSGSRISSRATFLPGVFKDIEWADIKTELRSKARIRRDTSVVYYAYKGVVVKKSIMDMFVLPCIKFMEKHYKNQIPYEVVRKGDENVVGYDKKQYVRNIASIKDLLTLESLGYELGVVAPKITENLREYVSMYQKDSLDDQSLTFLLMCLIETDSHHDVIQKIIDRLIQNLDQIRIDDMVFEYGEVLTGLARSQEYDSKISRILESEFHKIHQELTSDHSHDIFQLNWFSQSLIESSTTSLIGKKCIDMLTEKIIKLASQYDQSTESNYLCVAFEALAGLVSLCEPKLRVRARILMIGFMKLIEQRIGDFGLVSFLSGDSRIDISGHFLNGLSHLVHAHKLVSGQTGGNNSIDYLRSMYRDNKNRYKALLLGKNK